MSERLVIFDVDGTLFDSQADILLAMRAAFDALGKVAPSRTEILSIVGLSLPVAMARLAPDVPEVDQMRLVEAYKEAYAEQRRVGGVSPFYPGLRDLLDRLAAREDIWLGVATGKSRRGLSRLIEGHRLERHFVTTQVADDHPSKPHPSMLLTALSETGIDPEAAVMIGDTSFDMQMGRNARMATIGVTWGYHPLEALTDAETIVGDVDELAAAIGLNAGASL